MNSMKRANDVPCLSEIDGLGVIVFLGLSMLVYFAAMKPLLDRQKVEASQQKELEIQRTKAQQSALALQLAGDHLATIEAAIADSPQKLEPMRALNDRLARITDLATTRGLDIADIRPGTVATSLHYTTVAISLQGTGSFQNCVRYMHELHERFCDTTVTSLKLTGTPGDSSTASAFQFELCWYAAPERGNSVEAHP